MKHYYEVDGQRRYYIAKKISPKRKQRIIFKNCRLFSFRLGCILCSYIFFLTFVRNNNMRNKIQNLQDLEYTNNAILLGELINKWVKAKPKNVELLQFQQLFIDNSIYVAGLQNDLAACKMANSDYRERMNEAIYDLELYKEEMKAYNL